MSISRVSAENSEPSMVIQIILIQNSWNYLSFPSETLNTHTDLLIQDIKSTGGKSKILPKSNLVN